MKINRIKVLTNKYRKDQFWKNIKIFLDEQKDVNIPGPREQIKKNKKYMKKNLSIFLLKYIAPYNYL